MVWEFIRIWLLDNYDGNDREITGNDRKSSNSFVQIRTIQTFIQDELRSWPVELMTDENDLLVAYLKVKLIHCKMIQEVHNNDLIMVRLKNYIDSWIILWIEDRLDFLFMKILEILIDR